MKSEFLHIAPVLPSPNIERNAAWYHKHLGFSEFTWTKYTQS